MNNKTRAASLVAAASVLIVCTATGASLSFVSPSNGTRFDIGAPIPLRVGAVPTNTRSVRYYDGPSLIADVIHPYGFSWTVASRSAHTLRAIAVGDHGEAPSDPITLTVDDPTTPVDLVNDLDRYNVIYTALGTNARDSMPLGNGDISLNAWTYENGDVGLLIGKIDAFSGNAGPSGDALFSLRKIGRVRISLDPPVFKGVADKGLFRQTLVLSEAAILFTSPDGELRVWVDKNRPTVRVQWSGHLKTSLTLRNDSWRTNAVAGVQLADKTFSGLVDQIAWCYHDPRTNVGYRNSHEKGLWETGAKGAELMPPLTTVTFGALVEGNGLRSVDATTLRSPPANECRADIHVLRDSKLNEATPETWLAKMQAQVIRSRSIDGAAAWNDHRKWWRDYWDRGYLRITGGPQHDEVTRMYLQQRFVNACQTGPMKDLWRVPFNCGLFNVDLMDVDVGRGVGITHGRPGEPMTPMTADYRKWGASDRPQNTRHVYGSRLQTGDDDQARAWVLWPSLISTDWQRIVEKKTSLRGAFMSAGCSAWEALHERLFPNREGQAQTRILPEGVGKSRGGRSHCFDVADEYLPSMIDYWELSGDEDFLTNHVAPYAVGLFKFFEGYFPRDEKGRLILWPGMTSEAYVAFPTNGYVPANPMGGVALLHTQLPRLLALRGRPGIRSEALALWQKVYDARPDIPKAVRRNGKPGLAPHEPDWDVEQKLTQGADRASLYAIWPYRAFMFPESGTSEEDHTLACNTLELDDHGSSAWRYADYCAAILGLTDRARKGVLARIGVTGQIPDLPSKGLFRFPAFNYSAPGFTDWTPDQEGGNIVLSTLNYMLWNWKGDTIYLCPAWPRDWDCEFKFRGPKHTLVQGRVKGGQVIIDTVSPAERRKDIVICPPR